MHMRIGCFLGAAVFCFLVSGMWDGGKDAVAAVIKVTPANVQAAIDALPAGTPESSKPKSLQAIVEDSATYVGDEDALDFAPGTYDDIGELILRSPLTLRKDPSMEGDVVITGELLIHIRSKDVKIEELIFRDVEIGKITILGRGESSSRTSPSAMNLNGPIELYVNNGMTIPGFLLARKALDAPADRPDKDHDYSSYTGQLTQDALDDHIDQVNTYYFEGRGISNGRLLYNPAPMVLNKDGFPVDNSGRPTTWDPDAGSDGKWDVFYLEQHRATIVLGHILINPRYYGAEASCPDSGNLTGIEITRNMFERTQIVAIRSTQSGNIFPGDKDCFVEVEITGNTFRNIGIGRDLSYIQDSNGNFITDGDGKRIPDEYLELSQYAIGLFNRVRKATISDNTIEGTTHSPIAIRNTPEGGRIAVRNNLIRPAPDEGAIFPRYAETQIDIRGRADDVEIMITGNRLLGSDNFYPYFVTTFDQFRRRAGWCRDPMVPSSATIAQLETLLQPRIWQSYVPDFPYPGGSKKRFFMPPEGRPAALTDLLTGFNGNNAQVQTDVVIGPHDVVRHKRCHPTSRIEIRGQDGVSIVGNDLGYVAGDDSGESYVSYGITLWRFGSDDPTLAEFTGNNIDYFLKGAVGFFGGNAQTSLSTRGNYLGPEALVPGTVSRSGELGEPVVRENAIGPQEKDPPTVPATGGGAMISETGTVITLTYDEALDEESVPAAAAFTVTQTDGDGLAGTIDVSGVEVSGTSVVLTLAKAPGSGNSVTVSYDPAKAGSGAGTGPIRDVAGNEAPALTSRMLTASRPTDPVDPNPMGPGEMQQPGPGGGDGGCALALGGSGGTDLGVLLPLLLAVFVFFSLRRDTRKEK